MRYLLLALALAATTPAARAEGTAAGETLHYAWELDAYAGYGQLAYPALDTTSVVWSNGGPAFALTVAYRGDHFTHPFVDVSYIPIISSGQYVSLVDGGGPRNIYASNSSWAWGLTVGPGWDIDWFRLRVGAGLYDVVVRTDVSGQQSTVSKIGLGFMASASILLWRPDPFAVGIEGRFIALTFPTSGVYQGMWSAGLTGRWDFVSR